MKIYAVSLPCNMSKANMKKYRKEDTKYWSIMIYVWIFST